MPSRRLASALSIAFALPLLALAAARPAEACSCLPPDLARSYNQSTDVLRARVLREFEFPGWRFYLARVRTIYKGCLEPGQWVFLTTSASSAACGIRLEPGGDWLLTARASRPGSRVLAVDLCGFNLPFEALTPTQIEFLDTRFNCCGDRCSCVNSEPVLCFADPCQIATCPAGECVSNYCGGCRAEFFDASGAAVCQPCARGEDCGFDQRCGPEGRCLPACESDAACRPESYCATDRACREDGACQTDLDCSLLGNQYPRPLCIGLGVCDAGACGWQCGHPGCVDLAGVDFGPCAAFLGWGVVDGRCAPVSGCDSRGAPLFPIEIDCLSVCRSRSDPP